MLSINRLLQIASLAKIIIYLAGLNDEYSKFLDGFILPILYIIKLNMEGENMARGNAPGNASQNGRVPIGKFKKK